MKTLLRCLTLLLMFALSGGQALAEDAEQPNIIFILADDLGYGDLGCYGQKNFATPRIDQLANEGLRFTQHYAGCTVCFPSRSVLLTGQHMGHVLCRANGDYQFPEDPQEITIASRLKQAGYHTAMIGKSGLSCRSDDPSLPNRKGFDHFFGYLSHGAAHRYYPEHLYRNGEQVDYPGNHGKEGDTYSGDLFLADALRYLDERAEAGGPFFLHLSLQQPHADLQVTQKYREQFIGQFDEQPAKGGGYRDEAHPKSTFAGMVTYLDTTVGQVIDKLHQTGMAENTLVIFSSDNGAMSEGGWSAEYFTSSGPLRGGKRDMYEGGLRVPTIAYWPGTITAGTESDHQSAFYDFAATACELAGIAPPANTDGISYVPTLTGAGSQPTHEYLYWEFYEQGGKQAVRYGDWKGVRLNVNKNRNAPIELYNLADDLGEQHDIAANHPEVVKKIAAIMDEAHEPSPLIDFGQVRKKPKK
ncbi:arylsulfatase [Aeoliella mucimassa]|uniref:Arylsulfatase n=1 Tax=Aeoliella mucimassa TaxID=2527972 RepID=A0A518AGU1_9BACT|nr:arylsulfatase [Aeoliella mucimassa]QDU53946.1 Arylsulfatase [Aeoliella mucimassa]